MKFRHKPPVRTAVTALMAACIVSLCISPVNSYADTDDTDVESQEQYEKTIESNSIENWPQGPEVYAAAAIVMEANTGTILYAKDIDTAYYPASITKIMTAILTLENCELDEVVTYSYNATHSIESGSSSIYTTEGEELTVEESLYALLLESANECANGLAEHVAGTIDDFVDMMNEKAEVLGCTNTHFANANGLHDDDHYTTAHDMALIMAEALKFEDFVRISGTAKYQMQPTNKRDEITYMTNHHYMIAPYKGVTTYLDDTVIAGKTGGTSMAKNTLVTAAERNGMTLIVVTMRTIGTDTTGVPTVTDTALLLDYASENFTIYNVSENEENFSVSGTSSFYTGSSVFGGSGSLIEINSSDSIVLPNDVDFSDAVPELVFTDGGDSETIATLSYTYNGQAVGTASLELVTENLEEFEFDVETSEGETVTQTRFITINVRIIAMAVCIVILLLLLIKIVRSIRRRFRPAPKVTKGTPYKKVKRTKRMFGDKKRRSEGRYVRTPKDRGGGDSGDLDL